MNPCRFIAPLLLVFSTCLRAQTTQSTTAPSGIQIGPGLAIEAVGRAGRTPSVVDPIEAQVVADTFKEPKENDAVTGLDGREHQWKSVALRDGAFSSDQLDRNGWLYVPVEADRNCVALLTASGHSMVYVNGYPRVGDPYEAGYVTLPITLNRGRNDLLFASAGRGHVNVKIELPKERATAILLNQDITIPDCIRDGPYETQPMGVLLANLSDRPFQGQMTVDADDLRSRQEISVIAPLSVRKVWVNLSTRGPASGSEQARSVKLTLDDSTLEVSQRIRKPGESYKRTFLSAIDDSAQYFAIQPSPVPSAPHRALVLSLHGASVEAISQADAYSTKDWCDIVCPTNRRPYGFDWEDWGRLDAMEVLAEAVKLLHPDSSRIYLTGHSMGGHGTWQIGSLFPDAFAAIGPSAGWLSFQTYGAPRPGVTPASGPATTQSSSDVGSMFRRAVSSSDTMALMPNLAGRGVYILHGTDDDNVPVDQARQAAKILAEFHHDFTFFEQPKVSHWWDISDEPGADCVDWAPMFDLFARHRLPEHIEQREIDFRTPNPGISASSGWATIEAQQRPLEMSRIKLRYDVGKNRVVGETENVERLKLTCGPVVVQLDGQPPITTTVESWLTRDRDTGAWRLLERYDDMLKRPDRTGPFKMAFRNHMVFVYGTRGSAEENAATFAKARYDAEVWWYRGNGAVDVIADDRFDADKHIGNVILYGNADTNLAWPRVLDESQCPISVKRGELRIGETVHHGEDLACLFLFPRRGKLDALVGCVSATGATGTRLTNRLPYFASGVGYPDWCVMGPEVLKRGYGASRAAGFFDNDWKLSK